MLCTTSGNRDTDGYEISWRNSILGIGLENPCPTRRSTNDHWIVPIDFRRQNRFNIRDGSHVPSDAHEIKREHGQV